MGGGRRPLDPERRGSALTAEEELVLSWLLRRPGVAAAVESASEGREDEAVTSLAAAVRGLLHTEGAQAQDLASSPSPPQCAGASGSADSEAPEEVCSNKRASPEPTQDAAGSATASAPPAKRLTLSALESLPATCVCVVASGLHGCGKTALCSVLQEVLGGAMVNYDEFASKHGGKNVKPAFLQELRQVFAKALAQAAHDRQAHLVFVDRSHVLRAHRGDVLQELQRLRWRKRGGKALLVDFSHSSDGFGYGPDGQLSKRFSEQHMSACAARIEERGAAHPTLHPSPKLRAFLQSAAKAAEAPAPEELSHFDGRISIDVAQSPPEAAMLIFSQLRSLGWLPNLFREEILQAKAEVAWQAYQRAERYRQEGAEKEAEPAPHDEWLTQCRKAAEAEKEAERARAAEVDLQRAARSHGPFWKLDLPEISSVLSQRGILPTTFLPVERPHTVLLRLPGEGISQELAAREAGVSLDQYKTACEVLDALQGEELEVRMTDIVIEETIACAVIELPPVVPAIVKMPHVVLGTTPGTPLERAVVLLQQVRAGRTEGVTAIHLPKSRALTGRLSLEQVAPAAPAGEPAASAPSPS